MRYTQNQIDEAYETKESLQDMVRHLETVMELAQDTGMADVREMARDMLGDVQTQLQEVREILAWDYRRQVEEELREYMAAV